MLEVATSMCKGLDFIPQNVTLKQGDDLMKKEKNITELVPNKKYRIDIEAGRKHDGSRHRIVETINGTLKDAISRRDDLLYEIKHSKLKPDGDMNFLEFAKLWLKDYAEPNVKPTTLYGYRCNLNAYILPRFKDYKLNEIKVYDLDKFYNDLKKRPTKETQGKAHEKMLSSTTILKQHRQLSLMFNTAIKWEFIDTNPCTKVVKPPVKATPEMAYYNEEEIKQMLKLLDNEDLDIKVAVYMLVLGGLRRGELLGLYWEDIDFNKQEVKIYKNLLNLRGVGIKECTVKTMRSNRTVTLPSECFDLLKEYKQLQEDRKRIMGSKWHTTPYVFKTIFGGCIQPEWLSRHWKLFLEKNNLRHIRLHDLRHTCATYLLSIGTPLATVSRKLGHSDIYTTLNTYTHSLEADDKKAVEELSNRLLK